MKKLIPLLVLSLASSVAFAHPARKSRKPASEDEGAKAWVVSALKKKGYILDLIRATERNYAIQCPIAPGWVYLLPPGSNLPTMGNLFLANLPCTQGARVEYFMELEGVVGKAGLYLTRFTLQPSAAP